MKHERAGCGHVSDSGWHQSTNTARHGSSESSVLWRTEGHMSALLLVRSSDDIRSAVKTVSEFLVYRRHRLGTLRDADEVLGIWIRGDLDAGLPTWPCVDAVPGKTDKAPIQNGQTAPGCSSGETAVSIRESFSLSGIWTLCWIDGLSMREALSRAERRRQMLDSFLIGRCPAHSVARLRPFFPVFGASEVGDSGDAALRELQARYPEFVADRWFIDDRERGIVLGVGQTL